MCGLRGSPPRGVVARGGAGSVYFAGLKYNEYWTHQQHAKLADSFGFLFPCLTTLKPMPYLLDRDWEPIFHVLAYP